MSFVHLHCHSEYSLLDGANRIDDLIRRAQEFEQPALAITDHGNLHAAWEFQEKAKKAGDQADHRHGGVRRPRRSARRAPRRRRAPSRTTISSCSPATWSGYRNLVKLSSLAYTEGFYSKPRVDRELLAQVQRRDHRLLGVPGRRGRAAPRWTTTGRRARGGRAGTPSVFKDRYYLEVQAHDSEGQAKLNARVFALAEELGLPVIATNDAHFLSAQRSRRARRAALHRARQGSQRPGPDALRRGLYFKSAPEIASAFRDRPDVLENTLKIADEVGVEFAKKYHVPAFPLPPGVSTRERAAHDARDGGREGALRRSAARRTCASGSTTSSASSRRPATPATSSSSSDFIKAARDRGIPVGPGRGSAAGSLVAYALRITDVCPLKFDLLFERFLNPERVSMPDIDVDFCFERRGEVIEYVRQKYGTRVGRARSSRSER